MLKFENTKYFSKYQSFRRLHVNLLLENDGEISNHTTTNTKQRLRKQACFHDNERKQEYLKRDFYTVSAVACRRVDTQRLRNN
jgi:hypothetical protein